MNSRVYFPAILVLVLAISACTKEDMKSANSDKLQRAILAGNPDDTEIEINKICATLPAGLDSEASLDKLTKAISSQSKLNTAVLCHNCIYTLPAQSEIKITIVLGGIRVDKIIDITRSGDRYVFAGMHN